MLKNGEIDLLVKMENLIGMNEEILFPNKGNNEVSEVAYSDFISFINLIEKEMQVKKAASEKSNKYNKEHPDKYREQSREYARRKKERQKEDNIQ